MPEKKEEIVEMRCEKCDEPFHARVISKPIRTQSPISLRASAELFCPKCGTITNLIRQFKKQIHAKKIKRA